MNMKHFYSFAIASALAAVACAAPNTALAQPSGNVRQNGIQGVRIEVHGTVGYYQALGGGMRVEIPILKDGFTDKLDDEFALSFGGDVTFLRWGGRYDFDPSRPGRGRGWGSGAVTGPCGPSRPRTGISTSETRCRYSRSSESP